MNHSKAEYFDSQVTSEWACREYTEDELEKINRMLRLAGWAPDMKILEPGCGTGRLTDVLANRAGPRGFILASDISEKMVQASVERLGRRETVRVECNALESLSLNPEEFDLVICHQVFPHFDDKERAMHTFAACLKPFGRIVLFHFMSSAHINDMHRKTDASVMADSIPDPDQMKRLFHASGFTIDLLEDNHRGYLLIATRSPPIAD